MPTSSLILFNKPYGVQSQFRDDSNNNHTTLSQYFTDKSLRVAGRLDATSEGLLILTDDGRVNKAITHPPKANAGRKQGKTYLVQVEGVPTTEQLNRLRSGVILKDGKTCLPISNTSVKKHYPCHFGRVIHRYVNVKVCQTHGSCSRFMKARTAKSDA